MLTRNIMPVREYQKHRTTVRYKAWFQFQQYTNIYIHKCTHTIYIWICIQLYRREDQRTKMQRNIYEPTESRAW